MLFIGYSLFRGVKAVVSLVRGRSQESSITREAAPRVVQSDIGVAECTSSDITLSIGMSNVSVALGGSAQFEVSATYTQSASCLLDASNSSMVITVTSGDDMIWRSNVCDDDEHWLLLAKGDVYRATRTWNTVRSYESCQVDDSGNEIAEESAHVNAGTYNATVTWDGVTSDPVSFIIQ